MYRAWYGPRAAVRLTPHLPIRNGYAPGGRISRRPHCPHILPTLTSALGTVLDRNNCPGWDTRLGQRRTKKFRVAILLSL